MLSFLIYVLSLLLVFAVYYGVTLSLAERQKSRVAAFLVLGTTILGFLTGTGIYVAKRLEPKKLLTVLTRVNRQLIATAWVFVLAALVLFLVGLVLHKVSKAFRVTDWLTLGVLSLACIPLQAHLLPQLFLKTGEFVAFGEDSIGTETLFRAGGYFLGLVLFFLITLCLYHVLRRLQPRAYRLFGGLMLLALTFDMTLRGISSLARLRILSSRVNLIFDIMIFEDKSLGTTALCYLVVLLLASVWLFRTNLKVKGEFKTKAALRKHRWWLRNCRRWAAAAACFFVLSFVLVTAVNAYINRPVQLAPAEQYIDDGDKIIIPLTMVEDGHLHRFAYMYGKHNIRFIVVRKPNSNAYGLGLDACDICGIAGYFERNDTVVCKRCDVVMNKATIGFKGGCNPVPFPYVVKDGKIVIQKADLQKEKDRFPIGE